MSELPELTGPHPSAAPVAEWRRLDTRMLLVHPVQELIRFFPAVVGALVLGGTGESPVWQLLGVGIPVAIGVIRFLTTRYRVTDTQVELQRGLVGRTVVTARLDRVRAVELTASPIHRLLGLAKVEIGTGTAKQDQKFALDAMGVDEARRMRVSLLHRGGAGSPGDAAAPATTYAAAPDELALLRFDPGWVRYAPLTSSGNVIAAAVLAGAAQVVDRAGVDVFARFDLETVADAVSLTVAAAVGVVAFLVLGAVFAVTGYLVSNWGFSLTLDPQGRTFHVRRGLVTTTETSLERERVRGVELGEPFGLRLAGAARMAAIVTGVSRSERGSNQIVPPAPLGVVTDVGARVLADEGPLQVALRQHGPAARRRRWTRALLSAALVPATVALLCAWTALPWWVLGLACLLLVPAAWVAEDRYRRLGHALTPGHLVARSGTFRGRRDMLQRGGIIGWNIQQSWFQRRAGLATLVATTAAGQQAYAVPDLPEHEAVALADAAVPGLVAQFMAR